MSTLQAVLAIIGALFVLAALGGGLYVAARSSASDVRERRLREENEDLVRRLDWIEPRFKQAEQQNQLLLQLHNPTSQLEALGTQAMANYEATVAILNQQSAVLHEIDEKLHAGGKP